MTSWSAVALGAQCGVLAAELREEVMDEDIWNMVLDIEHQSRAKKGKREKK